MASKAAIARAGVEHRPLSGWVGQAATGDARPSPPEVIGTRTLGCEDPAAGGPRLRSDRQVGEVCFNSALDGRSDQERERHAVRRASRSVAPNVRDPALGCRELLDDDRLLESGHRAVEVLEVDPAGRQDPHSLTGPNEASTEERNRYPGPEVGCQLAVT